MANSGQFRKTPVKAPNRSGFDLSHNHCTTLETGTLVPVLCKELMPNSSFSLGALASCQLPPFATDLVNGKVDLRLEAFFVPMRQMWLSWKDFISTQNIYDQTGSVPTSVPLYRFSTSRATVVNSDTPTLEDYLGLHSASTSSTTSMAIANPFPLIAYSWVYQHWYRDSRIQNAPFVPSDIQADTLINLPWKRSTASTIISDSSCTLHDGVALNSLRQRNYDRDYFTTGQLTSTAGAALRVSVPGQVDEEDPDQVNSEFTITALRQVNALQRFSEILGQIGNHYGDYIHSMYGKYPSSEITERPIFLGSISQRLYSAGVDNNSGLSAQPSASTKNPYSGMLGSSAGQVGTVGSGSLCDSFTTDEFGYVMVLASIVPIPTYSTDTNKDFAHKKQSDFANHMFAGIGNQPIYRYEVDRGTRFGDETIFAWTDRFAEYKFINDRCTGSFRDGLSLSSFALKRGFATGSTQLNSAFIQIPKNALADVMTYYDTAKPAFNMARLNVGFKFHVTAPIPAYSIPTLEDPSDTHTIMVDKAGTHI